MSFGFDNLGHAFASALHDVHVGLSWVAREIPKLQADAPTVEAITGLVSPQAATIERAAFAILGDVAAAVNAADQAALANGMDVKLDASTVQSVKNLIADLKPQLMIAVPSLKL
jgi:hypothetical protein